jgi:tetratricopeptide (TPR) repeat protein
MRRILRALSLVLAVCAVAATAKADDRLTAREAVGRPVQQAQHLLKQKKFAEALAKLREAEGVKDKTPYERYVVEETRAAAEVGAGEPEAALKSLDAVIATGVLPPPERSQRLMLQVQLAYQAKRWGSVAEYADRYYKEGGTERTPRLLAAQAHYLDGKFAEAAAAIRTLLKTEEKPAEDLLLTLASAESQSGSADGYRDALTRLVSAYPKPAYWSDLVAALQGAPGFPNRLALDLDRLRAATGAMDAPGRYVEAAERALSEGFPGDAKSFLDDGFRAGLLGAGARAEREKRLADMASRQAAEDAKSLDRLAKEAESARDGLAWVKLGEAYASYGQHERAIAAFEKGIAKGGLEHPEDARLRLGVSCLKAGQAARAREVLNSISGGDGAAAIARLWLLHASAERT